MLDLMKALNDPEFMSNLSALPEQLVGMLTRILEVELENKHRLDLLLQHYGISANLQNSISANLQNGLTETPAPANVNPVDPDSYK